MASRRSGVRIPPGPPIFPGGISSERQSADWRNSVLARQRPWPCHRKIKYNPEHEAEKPRCRVAYGIVQAKRGKYVFGRGPAFLSNCPSSPFVRILVVYDRDVFSVASVPVHTPNHDEPRFRPDSRAVCWELGRVSDESRASQALWLGVSRSSISSRHGRPRHVRAGKTRRRLTRYECEVREPSGKSPDIEANSSPRGSSPVSESGQPSW